MVGYCVLGCNVQRHICYLNFTNRPGAPRSKSGIDKGLGHHVSLCLCLYMPPTYAIMYT